MPSIFDIAYGIFMRKQALVHADLVRSYEKKLISTPAHAIDWFEERTNEPIELYRHYVFSLLDWLLTERENTNYSFPLTESSLRYMANSLSILSGHSYEKLLEFCDEMTSQENNLVQKYIDGVLEAMPQLVTINPRVTPGRRLGWYALVRATKPRLIVETGIDKGLSSCILSFALILNGKEGFPGRYVGIDINPQAGYLYHAPFRSVGEIIYSDSVEALSSLEGPVDMLILDSDHTPGYETKELTAIESRLSDRAILVSDTAKFGTQLLDYARATNRKFLYVPEYISSWYPGDGNGYATRTLGERIVFQ